MCNSFKIEPLLKLGAHLTTITPPEYLFIEAEKDNEWFDRESIISSLDAIAKSMLTVNALEQFCNKHSYKELSNCSVSIIAAGNIPFVGFADILYSVLCGLKVFVKYASKDNITLRWLVGELNIFLDCNKIEEYKGERCNFVIATGSSNSNRYFQYNFASTPSLLRSNRTSIALLTGYESDSEIEALWGDIFSYYGQGCRNISTLFLPENYDEAKIWSVWRRCGNNIDNKHWKNCYKRLKAIKTIEESPFYDGSYFITEESGSLFAPIGQVNVARYKSLESFGEFVSLNRDAIQCIVGKDYIPFGKAQQPTLSDFADDIDVIEFFYKGSSNF